MVHYTVAGNLCSQNVAKNRVPKNHQPLNISKLVINNVIRLGFEPKTHSLEGCCSIQLSYRTEPLSLLILPWKPKWVQR